MKVYKDLESLERFRNAVVTIGAFDGVHAGHQKILQRLCQVAKEVQGESVLITFHPHPRLVLQPDDGSLRLLSTQAEKTALLEAAGIDHLVFVPFTSEFSQQSPEEYVRDFLVAHFQPARIIIGYDHKFGQGRKGDIQLLQAMADEYGYQVEEIPKQEIDQIAVSSTQIRKALVQGNVLLANELLGRYYSLAGNVGQGLSNGRGIGFPTANLQIDKPHKLIPATGVYAAYAHHEGHRYEAMLYFGRRPTIEGHDEFVCEVHLFDFDKNIYGQGLRVELVDWIRGDQRFGSLQELKQQLIQDKAHSLARLGQERQQSPITRAVLAVVILNWNGEKLLREFLPTVLEHSGLLATVYVADNGSEDGSIALLKQHFPQVKIIDLVDNHGFAKGYNQALAKVHADYFVLLNSDAVPAPGWLPPIIELMERDKTVGACQPKILDCRQKSHFEYAGAAGGWLDALGYPFCRGRILDTVEEDKGQYDQSQEIFWASGAALFVRAELYRALGGLDEGFFAHWEEIDFCWRLKRAGYKVICKPKSVVYHLGGGTLNGGNPHKTYLNVRNSLATLYKNETKSRRGWLILARLLLDGLAGIKFLLERKPRHIWAIVRGHWHFFGRLREYHTKRPAETEAIEKISIGPANLSGRYKGSILWQYYAKRKRAFRGL